MTAGWQLSGHGAAALLTGGIGALFIGVRVLLGRVVRLWPVAPALLQALARLQDVAAKPRLARVDGLWSLFFHRFARCPRAARYDYQADFPFHLSFRPGAPPRAGTRVISTGLPGLPILIRNSPGVSFRMSTV